MFSRWSNKATGSHDSDEWFAIIIALSTEIIPEPVPMPAS